MHVPQSSCKNLPITFSMVHLLYRLHGVDDQYQRHRARDAECVEGVENGEFVSLPSGVCGSNQAKLNYGIM